MKTLHTAKLLQAILTLQEWQQSDLAERAGLHRATVGQHLNGTRAVRDEHLRAYLRAVPAPDAPRLLSAWLHDILGDDHTDAELLSMLLDRESSRLREGVADWSPSLTERQKQDLNYWATNLPKDADLDVLLEIMTRRARGH